MYLHIVNILLVYVLPKYYFNYIFFQFLIDYNGILISEHLLFFVCVFLL